jgi:simple sugar transport system permease protein
MRKSNSQLVKFGFRFLAVILALFFTSIVLVIAKTNPIEAYKNLLEGAFGSTRSMANTLVVWVPLLLATLGLLFTFATGLWNIGIEGQIILGAICSTWALRVLQTTAVSPGTAVILAILAGILGGAIWASLVGFLRIYGGVNEIFGGLGLNFVAMALTIWLIFSPWKIPGVASMSGTKPFDQAYWLTQIEGLRLSPWAIVIGVISLVLVFLVLKGTYFGLRLKAVGKNGKAAHLLGIPTTGYLMTAFVICGSFAGLAGAIQVVGVYHRLVPLISSGYGYLGMMVAMLVNFQPLWAALVALFFAALNIGSIQLQIALKVDSTLAGVLQGALLLFFLMMEGVRTKFFDAKQGKQNG